VSYPKLRPALNPSCRRGGCLKILLIVFVVVVLLAGTAIFFTVRWVHKMVDTYTATAPVALPKSHLPDADYPAVEQRIKDFTAALNAGQLTAPLVLNEQELNAYLERADKEVGDAVYVVLDGDHIKGQVSYPLDSLDVSWVKGRYLNGNVTLDVSMQDHHLWVSVLQVEVNGQSPSDSMMQAFRAQNLAQNAMRDPKSAAAIAKFESIVVKDSKLIITPAAPVAPTPANVPAPAGAAAATATATAP